MPRESVRRSSAMEIIQNATTLLLEEASVKIMHSGYSTIIKESRDLSLALYDQEERLVAQPTVQPIHLAVLNAQTQGVARRYRSVVRPGDAFIANHPFEDAQNHASDVTIITPVFYGKRLVGWSANVAHKPDIGGKVPGSNAGDATDLIQEGLLIPPLQLVSSYSDYNTTLMEVIRTNSRTPQLTLGDIRAQVGANFYVERKLQKLFDKHGIDGIYACWEAWRELAKEVLRRRIEEWMPDGTWEAEDFMDDDGIDLTTAYRISVRVEKRGGNLSFTFDSDKQATGPINIRPAMVESVVYFAVKAILAPELPNNAGFEESVQIRVPDEGTLLNPKYLAPVNMYSMTSKRVCDVAFLALVQAMPSRTPAPESGYNAGLLLATRDADSGGHQVHYELLVGGGGARPTADGPNMFDGMIMNAMNAPVEAVESEFPVRIERYELIPDSGGTGEFRGGLGARRQYRIMQETYLNLRADRHRYSAQGVFGGGDGRPAQTTVNPGTDEERRLHSKIVNYKLERGDLLEICTAGGGGRGAPDARDPRREQYDLANGYITRET